MPFERVKFTATVLPMPSDRKLIYLVEPEVIAEQLTLIDYMYFSRISSTTFINAAMSPYKRIDGGRTSSLQVLLEYSELFRLTANWVSRTVLAESGTRNKAVAIRQIIKIAKALQSLNNYNTMAAVLYGLKTPDLANNQSIWENVGLKDIVTLWHLDHIISGSDNFAEYQSLVKRCMPPMLFYIGAEMQLLQDALMTMPTYLVNQRKFRPKTTFAPKAFNFDAMPLSDDEEKKASTVSSANRDFQHGNPILLSDKPVNVEKLDRVHTIIAHLEAAKAISFSKRIPIDASLVMLEHLQHNHGKTYVESPLKIGHFIKDGRKVNQRQT